MNYGNLNRAIFRPRDRIFQLNFNLKEVAIFILAICLNDIVPDGIGGYGVALRPYLLTANF